MEDTDKTHHLQEPLCLVCAFGRRGGDNTNKSICKQAHTLKERRWRWRGKKGKVAALFPLRQEGTEKVEGHYNHAQVGQMSMKV